MGDTQGPGGGSPSNIIPFRSAGEACPEEAARGRILLRRPTGDYDLVIHQSELALERQLARRASEALRALKKHREGLLWRYLEYHTVEPGPHAIDAILVNTKPRLQKGSTYYRLLVK